MTPRKGGGLSANEGIQLFFLREKFSKWQEIGGGSVKVQNSDIVFVQSLTYPAKKLTFLFLIFCFNSEHIFRANNGIRN